MTLSAAYFQDHETLFVPKNQTEAHAENAPVSENDVYECFVNRTHSFLMDTREDHKTDPITLWFISENDYGRRLKVCFMNDGQQISIKSAYVPNADEERIYQKYATSI